MHPLLSNESTRSMLLLGNEAIARGALEAGVAFATAYPGLNVQLDVHIDDEVDFSLTQVFIYRAVQELLINVVNHSNVKNARVVFTNTE